MKHHKWIAIGLIGVVLVGCGSSSAKDAATTSSSSTTATSAAVSSTTSVSSSTAPPATTPPPASTTSAAPPAEAPSWDAIKNASIPALCTHPAATLVNGEDKSLGPMQGYFRLEQTLSSSVPGFVQGVPSADGGPLTAVVASCNAGGVSWPNLIMFFGAGGKVYATSNLQDGIDWSAHGMNAAGRDGVSSISLQGDSVIVKTSAETGSDPSCCPSATATLTMHAAGGHIVIDTLTKN